MTRTKAFTAQRWTYTNRADRTFIIVKGASASARYYVTDPETGAYLSKTGGRTLLDAQIEAEGM